MHPKDQLLKDLFVVHAFDDESGLFMLDEGGLAFGAICRPIAGADAAVQEKLNLLLNLPLPPATMIQFCLYASPDIERQLEDFQVLRGRIESPLLHAMTVERAQFLRGATIDPVDAASGLRLHDVNLLITVKLPSLGRAPDPQDMATASEARNNFLQTLKTIGFAFDPLTAPAYLHFMRTVLNHRETATWRDTTRTQWDEKRLLCHQILDTDNAIEVDRDGLWLGEHARVRLLHVKNYPEYIHFGVALRFIGDYVTGARGIRDTLLITCNVLLLDSEKKRARMEADHAWTTQRMSGPMAKYMPSWKKRMEALDVAMKAVNDGDRLVRSYVGMAIIVPSETDDQAGYAACERRAIAAQSNARAYFREMQFQLEPDRYFCQPLFFQLLPFAAEAALETSLMRYRTTPTRHVVPYLPVLGAWRGTGTPMMTFHSRDGQLMTISPFDTGSNMNLTIAAQSGMGKSFLTNEMIQSLLSLGGRVWVIDIGYSYKNLCRQLNGEYLQFEASRNICLNPFSVMVDFTEEADVLAGIVQTMAAPNQSLTDFQIAGVKRILSEMVAAVGREASIDELARRLLAEPDPRLQDVGHQLFSFTSEGEYGKYFNGPNTFDANNPFIVCELEELNGRKHLQRVVLMQLMYQIQQQMYRGDRGQKKMLIIDEAWAQLAQNDARDFIAHSFRRVRKFGGSAVVITQSVNDLWANEGAIAIVENCANMYLLGQKGTSINMIEKEGRLSIGEAGFRLLRTVSTVPGQYSEIMFITEGGVGIGRLVVSDFNKLLYSTKAEDANAIQQHEKRGLPLQDAINAVLAERNQAQRRLAA